ncbi:MAG TPA: hypothetical protein VIN38_04535 [Thiobacillus sp.]
MPHHCPFPVRSTDSRCGYRTGGLPGLALSLAVIAALTCFTGLSHAHDMSVSQSYAFVSKIDAGSFASRPGSE